MDVSERLRSIFAHEELRIRRVRFHAISILKLSEHLPATFRMSDDAIIELVLGVVALQSASMAVGDVWRALSSTNAPFTRRQLHSAIWREGRRFNRRVIRDEKGRVMIAPKR